MQMRLGQGREVAWADGVGRGGGDQPSSSMTCIAASSALLSSSGDRPDLTGAEVVVLDLVEIVESGLVVETRLVAWGAIGRIRVGHLLGDPLIDRFLGRLLCRGRAPLGGSRPDVRR